MGRGWNEVSSTQKPAGTGRFPASQHGHQHGHQHDHQHDSSPGDRRPVNPWLVLSVTALGVLLVMVNVGAMNVALPAIARHFHTGAALSNWILLSFMLVNTVLILVFGQFSDSFGRRKLYLLGMAIFTLASFAVGFSPNIGTFLVLRVLQAAGGALVITNNTALITDAFPESKLGTGLSLNVLISSAAQLVGPVVGGALASNLGWEWVFWAGVPIGVIGVVWGMFALRKLPSIGSGAKLDWWGGIITLIGTSGFIIALSEGTSLGWGSLLVVSGFVSFVVLLPLLWWVERRAETPMFDLSLFRDQAYSMANIATFLNSFSRISVVLLVSLYLQSVLHDSAFRAGLVVLPVTIGILLASPVTGALSNRLPARILSTAGLALSAIGLILLVFGLRPHLLFTLNAIGMGLVGFGSGIFLTPNTRSIMLSVPQERRGFANGLRSMLQNMGQVFSTAISLTIVTAMLPRRLQDAVYVGMSAPFSAHDLHLLTVGYRYAMLVLLLATLLSMVASSLRGKPAQVA